MWSPETPGSFTTVTHFLLLTRPVRCREGQTADDAVLTLIFLILKLSSERRRRGIAKRDFRRRVRDWRIAQLTNRRIRTFITRPIARKTNNVAKPPKLISVNGMPETGMKLITIATSTKTWKPSAAATPMTRNMPALSFAR